MARWMNRAAASVVAHALAAGLLFLLTGAASLPTPRATTEVIYFETITRPPATEPVAPRPAEKPEARALRAGLASITRPVAARPAQKNSAWMKLRGAPADAGPVDLPRSSLLPNAAAVAERFLPFSAPTRSVLDDPAAEDKPASPLKAVGDGRFEADRPAFTAKVSRDGTMTFVDKPNLKVHAKLPCASCVARGLGKWAKDPYGYQTAGARDPLAGTSLYMTNLERGIAEEPAGQDQPEDNAVIVVGIAGSFDLSDWLLRVIGDDPYALEKLRLLEATSEQRSGMRTDETARRLRMSLHRLPRFLQAVWADKRVTAGQRRRTLFVLWDECAEEGSGQQLATAASVRASILAFVRRELPAGSEHAFGKEELDTLNKKRFSKEVFAPYAARE